MAGKRRIPVFTDNFLRNLDAIQSFLGREGDHLFKHLLDRLLDDIVPLLLRYPQSGRFFPAHPARSLESKALLRKLKAKMKKGNDLREWVIEDYLILYLPYETRVVFISIKHHRQLSFDFLRFWS